MAATDDRGRVEAVASARLPTAFGEFTIHGFCELARDREHVALVMGNPDPADPVLTRLHSECLTGDALFSRRCDCGPQLEAAMRMIAEAGTGVILYLRQEGRDIGLLNKLRAYALQDSQGLNTAAANEALGLPADARDYGIALDMLNHLGLRRVKLLTNNPEKIRALEAGGIEVVERVPLHVGQHAENEAYLTAKHQHFGHLK